MKEHEFKGPGTKNRRRVGRGESSGWGKTAGKGMGGQKKRSGKGKPARGFEGGQNPMYKRMPKRGFVNPFPTRRAAVNLDMLEARFDAGAEISLEILAGAGLASKRDEELRILGRGELSKAFTIRANHVSAAAKEKIEKAGGSIELLTR